MTAMTAILVAGTLLVGGLIWRILRTNRQIEEERRLNPRLLVVDEWTRELARHNHYKFHENLGISSFRDLLNCLAQCERSEEIDAAFELAKSLIHLARVRFVIQQSAWIYSAVDNKTAKAQAEAQCEELSQTIEAGMQQLIVFWQQLQLDRLTGSPIGDEVVQGRILLLNGKLEKARQLDVRIHRELPALESE